MSNCKLLAKVRVNKAPALLFFFRLLFMAITFLSLDLLLAHPAVAEPLYVGDFDGPLERNEYRPSHDIGGMPFAPQELKPPGRPSKIIPSREKGFVDFLKVEKNSKGQLFIKSDDKKVFLLKLSEAQVRFFFGAPNIVKKYDKRVKTAKLDQVFEYVCYNDDVLSKLIIRFEKRVVCSAVVKHWDATMGTPGLGNEHSQKDL